MHDKHERISPALVETVAGLTAGTVSTLVVHPLDVIKTRLQIHRSALGSSVTSLGLLRSLAQNEQPLRSLYRGLTPNLVGNASSWALFFYFKSLAETQLLIPHRRRASSSGSPGGRQPQPRLSGGDYFVSSGLAGLGIVAATNPIWVIKTRMLSSDRSAAGAYPSMWAGARAIRRDEGWRGFYRGLGIGCLGVLHGAVQFTTYESLKRARLRYDIEIVVAEGANPRGGGDEVGAAEAAAAKIGTAATLVISGAAKAVAGCATYPLQVVRSRLQTYDAEERFGRGITGVVRKVWREEGWRGFYRGVGLNVVRVLPSTWVTFLVYENVRFYLPQLSEQ